MKEKLAALYALQQLDSALEAIKRQYAAIDVGKSEKATYEAALAVHKEADTALHVATGALRDTELEQQGVEIKRKDHETKLYSGSVRAAKELQALQEEVEMLARLRGRLDEKILVLMEELEVCRTREAAAKATLTAAKKAYKAKYTAAKQGAETMAAQARQLSLQRKEAQKGVDPALLQRYDTLRPIRGGIAIATIEDGNACGACKMGLPSSLVQSVHVGNGLVFCDNCRRLLCESSKA